MNAAVKQKALEPYSVMSKLLLQMAPAQILSVTGRQVFDSRGNPTVEATVETYRGKFTASVPSGASTGAFEAVELRDGGSDYMGKGVSKAVDNVNEVIGPALVGKDPTQQVRAAARHRLPHPLYAPLRPHSGSGSGYKRLIRLRACTVQSTLDMMMVKELDGSESDWGYTKGKLGANAILAVSIALCKAGAEQQDKPLYRYIADMAGVTEPTMPVPAFNIINGGEHAGNKLAMQEFMILPTGAGSFTEAIKMASETYHNLKKIIAAKYGKVSATSFLSSVAGM